MGSSENSHLPVANCSFVIIAHVVYVELYTNRKFNERRHLHGLKFPLFVMKLTMLLVFSNRSTNIGAVYLIKLYSVWQWGRYRVQQNIFLVIIIPSTMGDFTFWLSSWLSLLAEPKSRLLLLLLLLLS